MKTEPLIDDTDLPRVRTAIAHFFMPTKSSCTSAAVDVLVPASERYHEAEVLRVAAFCGLWSFAAVGCYLPWVGSQGWMIAARAAICFIIWLPVWFTSIVLIITVPGALGALLEHQRVLSKPEALQLSTAMAALIFSITACLLLVSPFLIGQIVGAIWLLVLAVEGILRLLWLLRSSAGR